MRRIILFLAFSGAWGAVGCQARDPMPEDRVTTAKPVEHDDDFIQTRTTFEKTMRDRLARLDQRITQLEQRTDAAGHDAAVKLRARSDEIGSRMKQIGDQAEAGWDRFERDLGASVDSLEHDVDLLVY